MMRSQQFLCDEFGIDSPIIQAPMAGVQDARLAAAVSNAGALGSLPTATFSLEGLQQELQQLRSATRRSINLNFFCHVPPPANPDTFAHYVHLLSDYYHELGLDPADAAPGPGRAPFTADAATLVEEFKPEVVSFHFGLPEPDLIARVRAANSLHPSWSLC